MSGSENILAWLEQSSGGRVAIHGTCSIGRLSSNSIMLPDERVSRRHALINVQGHHEFWLVDLGSGNGTYLNERRVAQPTRLRDGDKIKIAEFLLFFHESPEATGLSAPVTPATADQGKTLQQIKSAECWLLVADIEDSTQLMKGDCASSLPVITGQWFSACKQLVEDCGGSVNKFLGDGFFAYWEHRTLAEEQVARALETLRRMQNSDSLAFRVVLHFGQVFMGGAGSLGEESLQGKEVHFVFRMEKLAGTIGKRCLISDAAKSRFPTGLPLCEAGRHAVAGFDGEHPFYMLVK
jgi:pSer/pThr/pTyr-binding forkhead associated (FHA) protein